MLKNKLLIALCLIGSIAFTGCTKEEGLRDGDWSPIQITVNGNEYNLPIYKVAAAGGEYKIYSKNYGRLWLIDVVEDGNRVWPNDGDDRSDFENLHVTKDWYEIQYDVRGNIVVSISAKEKSAASRSLMLSLENGDAFSSITLLQE